MSGHVDRSRARAEASFARAAASLRRTREILLRVLDGNRRLRELPGHEASADQRIAEGTRELEQVEAELAGLEDQGRT